MPPEIAQPIITAAATIAGVIVAHLLLMWTESRRVDREDERRWHADRHRLMQEVVEISMRAERKITTISAFMPVEETDRIIHMWEYSDEEGVPGLLDAADFSIVKEDLFAITDLANECRQALAALSLVAEGDILERGREVIMAIEDAEELVTHLHTREIVDDAAHEVLHAQIRFSAAGRQLLGAGTS